MDPHQSAVLFYVLLYYFLLIGLRIFLLYRQTGINPIRKMKKSGLPGIIEWIFLVTVILISFIGLNFVVFPQTNYQLLLPFHFGENNLARATGVLLAYTGVIVAFIAQLQMGNSWRLGISENEQTELCQRGLYRYSRNPVYLGLVISYSGFFLMLPNALSLIGIIGHVLMILSKVRQEEQFLLQQHGEPYSKYRESVNRWLGRRRQANH